MRFVDVSSFDLFKTFKLLIYLETSVLPGDRIDELIIGPGRTVSDYPFLPHKPLAKANRKIKIAGVDTNDDGAEFLLMGQEFKS